MLIQIHEPGDNPALKEKTGAIVGIDFGTTHSLVAIAQEEGPIIIPVEGAKLVPSIITYDANGYTVGNQSLEKPGAQTIKSIKRHMEPHKTEGFKTFFTESGYKTSIQIAADILRYLKTETEHALGETITGAVITVPAHYSEVAREATRTAAYLAGIPLLRLLSEPTAAALAYHLDEQEEGEYLIYDFGGGTFDVSVLRLEQGIFQVLAVGGDGTLGGDDIDQSLWNFMKLGLPDSQGLRLARSVKEYLTYHPFWEGGVHKEDIKITRSDFNSMLAPFVEKTLKLCENTLKEANVSKQALKAIVLVGGSTRIPYLQQRLHEFFGQEPLCSICPDEAVALGAALHAQALKTGKGKLLLDVTPFSLGIETLGGNMEVIIPRNSPLPNSASERFTTSQDGQTKIKIHVLHGEGSSVEQNQSLATFVLANIPPAPAGHVQLKVTFILDGDGILSVSAEDSKSGIKQNIHVRPSYF